MRLRTLFAFVLLILLAGATSATAASKEVSRQSSTELGVQATMNAPVTIYQCNWYFCNKCSVEGTARVLCKTTGHFEGGGTGRWDLVLDKDSFVVGFYPGSTGAVVPNCPNLGVVRPLSAATVYQCNWYFCNKGSVEGTARVLCKTTGHFVDGSTGRWDLILDESSFVVGFRPGSTGATVPDCQDLF